MNSSLTSGSDGDERFDLEREPLDRPSFGARDWGGDGSDLSRPVRAHVLAALRSDGGTYPPEVDALRRLGEPRQPDVVERRHALGLEQRHLPDLVRMVRDRSLYTADSESSEVWAPVHALDALADLDAAEAVPDLLPLFDLDDDWFSEALPRLLGRVGAPALAPLRSYLADRSRWGYGHSSAIRALEEIVEQHPDLREQVVDMLGDVLREAETYHEAACTAAMDLLVDLGAVEALPLIRRAFELGKIDEIMRGDWGRVLADLGVEPEPGDPLVDESRRRFEERQERFFPSELRERVRSVLGPDHPLLQPTDQPGAGASLSPRTERRKTAQERVRKQKNKRKIEAASRKANRKRRK